MSLKRTKAWLTAMLIAVVSVMSTRAEPSLPNTAPTVDLPRWSPFIEPTNFGPDLQFFAPFDPSLYGGGDPPNIGFFFDYSRLYWNVQRPSQRPINRVG